ncbi:MAG: hypothetical protein Q9222_001039 [Ikaeria aurantiellina]
MGGASRAGSGSPNGGLSVDQVNGHQASFTTLSTPASIRRNDLTARHWHNRYIAWQARDRRQREEREKLLAEQRRIFGGENEDGDEDGLCSSMMEYFAGLDFIMETDEPRG